MRLNADQERKLERVLRFCFTHSSCGDTPCRAAQGQHWVGHEAEGGKGLWAKAFIVAIVTRSVW